MFRSSTRKAVRNLLAAVALCLATGCQAIDYLHCKPKGERLLGTVRAGGPMAAARTLPIPLEGLTLSQAVEATIRPGLHDNLPVAVQTSAQTTAVPVGLQSGTSMEKIKNVVTSLRPQGGIGGDPAPKPTLEDVASQLAALGDDTPILENEIESILSAADDEGLFAAGTDLTAAQKKRRATELYESLASAINSSITATQTSREISPQQSARIVSAPVTSGAVSAHTVAVQLTRRTGNRIIVPLPLVRNYSPGDIWLTDGDMIHILPGELTEAGQTLAGESGDAVSGFQPDGDESGINLFVLLHKSILDGRREEYLIPASNSLYYGKAGFVGQWQQMMKVHSGDQLKAGTLELMPIIRNSQINAVAASAAAIEERVNPKVHSLKDKLDRKFEREREFVSNLPVISHVHNQVRQQIGPVPIPGLFRQTTGFDREEFCRNLTP